MNLEQQIQELKKQFNDKVAQSITEVLNVPLESISVDAEDSAYNISINLQGVSFYRFKYDAESNDVAGFAGVVEFEKNKLPAIVPVQLSIKVLEAVRDAVSKVVNGAEEQSVEVESAEVENEQCEPTEQTN